jgi:hypothetical protein
VSNSCFDSCGRHVRADGVIVLLDRTKKRLFWSAETVPFGGRWVTMMKPRREDHEIVIYPNGEGTEPRIVAYEILDTGFEDIEGLRETRKRLQALRSRTLEVEQTSIVARKIVALVQLVDQRIQDRDVAIAALRPSLLARTLKRLGDLFPKRGPAASERVIDRELLLESDFGVELGLSDAVLVHALAVFEFPDTFRERVKAEIAVGHKAAPACDGGEPSEAELGGHRLCEVSE